ncbi:MAG: protein kinase domain-containing protein [Planctomycetota bacterium]|jgi:serine/threonine protein kinase
MARLRIVAGDDAGKEFELSTEKVVLGRRSTNAVVIDHPKASRDHAEVCFDGEKYILKDLDSSNGTYLNGFKITEEQSLEAGDEIRVGGTVLRLFIEQKPLSDIKIPGYTIKDIIAQGGMGAVYRAVQVSMDRFVALKVLHAKYAEKREWVDRFVQEARSAGKLNHPNIIGVHDVGKAGTTYYFSMELVKGNDLSQVMAYRTLEFQEVMNIGAKVADALDYAHKNKLIHRDIKPENIMLSEDGEVKLADLGIAKSFEMEGDGGVSSIGQTKKVLGTPHYMSPEQASGQSLDGKSDLYSLGATLYHVLAEAPPFEGETNAEIMTKHLTEEPPALATLNPMLPKPVTDVIEKLMSKKPGDRFESAGKAMEALEKAAKARPRIVPQKAKGDVPSTSLPRSGKRVVQDKNAVFKQAGVFAAVLIVALIVIFSLGEDEVKDTGPVRPTVADIMSEAAGLANGGKYQEAIDRYSSVETEYPQDFDSHLSAKKAIDELREKIERDRQLADADKKWKAFEKWESSNAGDLDEIEQRLEAMVASEPLLKAKASGKLSAIRDARNKELKAEQEKKIRTAKAKAEAAVITLKIDGAMNELVAFRKEYPGSEYDADIQKLLDQLNSAAEKRYGQTRKTAEEYIGRKRFSQAISAYREFINDVAAESVEAKAEREIKKIESDLETMNNQLTLKVQNAVKEFKFDSAIQSLSSAEMVFSGTAYSKKLPRQKSAIALLRSFHNYLIGEIKKVGRKDTGIKVSAYMDGKKSLKIISASSTGISIPLTGAATTVISWSKLKPEEVYKIYKHYTPKDNKKWQTAIKIYKALFKISG